jgi:hypothetical protein
LVLGQRLERSFQVQIDRASGASILEMKARQRDKIIELGQSLVTAGIDSLDAQASALGLGRSTTWIILKANHKASGLSASIVKRILRSPDLPLRPDRSLRNMFGKKWRVFMVIANPACGSFVLKWSSRIIPDMTTQTYKSYV